MKVKFILGMALILSSIAYAESKDLSCANKAGGTLQKTDQQSAEHRLREVFVKDSKSSNSGSSSTSR